MSKETKKGLRRAISCVDVRVGRLEALMEVKQDEFGAWSACAMDDIHGRIAALEKRIQAPTNFVAVLDDFRNRIKRLETAGTTPEGDSTHSEHWQRINDLQGRMAGIDGALNAIRERVNALESGGADPAGDPVAEKMLRDQVGRLARERDGFKLRMEAAERGLENSREARRAVENTLKQELAEAHGRISEQGIRLRDLEREKSDYGDRIEALETTLHLIANGATSAGMRRQARAALGLVKE